MELEVLELSQRLHQQLAQPSPCSDLEGRFPLGPLNSNVNPFGLTHQRNKAARKAVAATAVAQQAGASERQQPRPDAHAGQQSGNGDEEMGRAGGLQGAPNGSTPLPSVLRAPASRPSPTPFALFRGRLSFGIDGSSARKFEASSTPKVKTLAIKRKLTDSPSGDLLLVFPSVKRMAACRRRCPSLCDLAPMSDDYVPGPSTADAEEPSLNYWSDPLPLPGGVGMEAAGGLEGTGGEDSPSLRDDAASPLPASLLAAAAEEPPEGASMGPCPGPVSAGNGALRSPFFSWRPRQDCASRELAGEGGIPSSAGPSGLCDRMDTDSPICCQASSPAPAGKSMDTSSSGGGHSSDSCGFPPLVAGTAASPPPSRLASGCAAALPPPFSPLASGPVSAVPLVDHPDCGLPSITPQTAAELVSSGGASHGFERCIVVDCRYEYEYQGGCIWGALNINTPEAMERFLEGAATNWQATALVLHCEFSSERGPRMFRHVREADRRVHLASYPALSYPHMFILQGGYKAFVRSHPQLCTPAGAYTPMDHPEFSEELKACHKAVKAAWAKMRRSYETVQQRRGRRYVLRPTSGQRGGCGSSGPPPALEAARHFHHAPSL